MSAKDEGDTVPTQPKDRATAMQEFLQTFSLSRLVDPREPWVLVDEGSFLKFFDYVPRHLRVGPWSIASICYLFAIPYLAIVAFLHFGQQPWVSIYNYSKETTDPAYPSVSDLQWWYNVVVFFWMFYVNYVIISATPVSFAAWSTYTVQSWTLLWIRHGLCVLAPFYKWTRRWAEYIRFPVACSVTITFVVWNFVLMPAIYRFGMKTPRAKRGFLKFCFGFRLSQLHIFNIIFCALNILWTSPPRPLETLDFLAAVGSVLVYIVWYLGVLDRVGIHFYPIFSPRHNGLVIASWTALLVAYGGTFCFWQRLLAV